MKKLLFILFCFINIIVYGTNYYVSNTGDDDSTGTSAAKAWKTLAKVNTITLQPGDTVFLNRGDTWKERLLPAGDGTTAKHIVFTAYGTGAKPIISGRDTVSGWSVAGNWTDIGGNIWTINYSPESYAPPRRFWLSGVEQKRSRYGPVSADSTCRYSSNKIYVYSATNPATTFTAVETEQQRIEGVYLNQDNHFTFSYIDFQYGWFSMRHYSTKGTIVDSCDFSGHYGIYSEGYPTGTPGGAPCDSVTVKNSKFDTGCTLSAAWEIGYTQDGIYLWQENNNWEIYDCYFKNWHHASFYLHNSTDADYDITNVKFHDNYVTAPDINYGGRLATDIINSSGNEIYNNIIYNIACRNQFNSRGLRFYCNIINTVRKPSFYPYADEGDGINIAGYAKLTTPDSMLIYNNTILNCGDNGISISGSTGYANKYDNEITNNIIYNCTDYAIYIKDHASVLGNTFKNNLIYKAGTSDLVYYGHDAVDDYPHTVAEFNAENGTADDVIANNITGNPLFYDENNDTLSLNSTSPAIGAGIAIEWLTTDIVDSTFLDPPAIGAYEYYAYTPPSLSVVETSSAVFTYPLGATITSNVVDDGGGTVSARGVCYSTVTNPTTSDSKVTGGTGTGAFTSSITGLTKGTLYYVRAYATNEAGTSYGNQLTVKIPSMVRFKCNTKFIKDSGKYVKD